MSGAAASLLAIGACCSAFCAGVLGAVHFVGLRTEAQRKVTRMRGFSEGRAPFGGEGIEGRILAFAWRLQEQSGMRPHDQPIIDQRSNDQCLHDSLVREQRSLVSSGKKSDSLFGLIRRAGFAGQLDPRSIGAAQRKLAGGLGVAGGLLGAAISPELGLVIACLGLLGGWLAPEGALRRFERKRAIELEKSLPEMLEVVALGLRSGLSFDRSLQLYSAHFPSSFAQACSSAQKSWSLGLRTREEALRELVKSYRSDQLERTIERIIRSLRFGSALAPDLESAAAEARARRRAQVEERVAKAPVKMMVPTGALILPAMLIMVLGPVLLELMNS